MMKEWVLISIVESLAIYALFAWVYLRYAGAGRADRVLHRLAWPAALMLGVALVSRPLGIPAPGAFYVTLIVAAASAALLPAETRNVLAGLRRSMGARKAMGWFWLTFAAFAAVCVFESTFDLFCGKRIAVLPTPGNVAIAWNALLLICVTLIGFLATNRLALSALIVFSLYAVLSVCNIIKMRYMHACVQPLDLLYISEFVPFAKDYFGLGALLAVAAVFAAWCYGAALLWRRGAARRSLGRRIVVAVVSALVLAGTAMSNTSERCQRLIERLGVSTVSWDSIRSVHDNGLLLELALEFPATFVRVPGDYSEAAIERCVSEYHLDEPARRGNDSADLIIYMVESLMDPQELGLTFTSDPIPNLRAIARSHASGHAITPRMFGGSATSEFEVLTGMSQFFLPEGCCPYKQYVKRDIPSLPRLLGQLGYRTSAIYADPQWLYSRRQACPHLGFDQITWLCDRKDVPLDVAGRWPSDEAVVDAVIDAARQQSPCFIFAFNSATHSPYNYEWPGSDLDVAESMPEAARAEIRTYINAVRETDRAIGKMLEHFARSPRRTVIVIVGDHLPPLGDQDVCYRERGVLRDTQLGAIDRRRMAPLYIWTNFGRAGGKIECGLNFVPAYALAAAGVRPSGILKLNALVSERIGTLSTDVRLNDGRRFDRKAVPSPYKEVLRDYELMQYDLLFGKQYGLRLSP